MRFMVVLTDAPAHGLAKPSSSGGQPSDNYAVRHPHGLTPPSVMGELLSKNIDLFLCSFNPDATSKTEEELCKQYATHSGNSDQRQVSVIPLVQANQSTGSPDASISFNRHIIFVLDESGSMRDEGMA
uniref:VWFA domain-containing protein n=1 Tax=Entomoneis paludosa TaxID=265537 RepID=A0A7S2Y4N2_9STRA|mmetsp:Transcript_18503/g.38227  ORF Transcript_18503/g.38227 Transcript_18503/m.38227 type:complete len:128 (+) Transcript_18503:32-415(+)